MCLKKLNLSGKTTHTIGIFNMRILLNIICLLLVSIHALTVFADQYQSNELLESKGKTKQAIKSITELESELSSLTDDYAKDSTARYLARHYAQKNTQESIKKAIEYYLISLNGKGLSVYAQQATMLELLALYFQQKNYTEFIRGYDRYQQLKGVPSPQLSIKKMLAYYHLDKKNEALKIANGLYNEQKRSQIVLELNDLKQILYVFFHTEDFLNAAHVQQLIISIDDHSVEQWLRLSKLHLRNNKPDQAAEVLLVALQKGLAFEQEDLLLMCDLLSKGGNPFLAARLMQQLLNKYYVDQTVENLDRLFRYWYLSAEIDKAAKALKATLKYDDSTQRYLDLSELYYQLQDWKNMNLTIKEACTWPLKDKYVSRANLLLGISELKLNKEEQAIKAFYNATMISGKIKEALAYLHYLNVDVSDTRRYEQITGVCAPEKVKFN